MRVGGCDGIRTGQVDIGMNGKSRPIDRMAPVDDLAVMVAADQVRDALTWLKCTPNGLTQKVSGNSGSRAVMWPATPSSKPNLENSRKAAAKRCLRCSPLLRRGLEYRGLRQGVPDATGRCLHGCRLSRGGDSRCVHTSVSRKVSLYPLQDRVYTGLQILPRQSEASAVSSASPNSAASARVTHRGGLTLSTLRYCPVRPTITPCSRSCS